MKTRLFAVVLLVAVVCACAAQAVPPAYSGQFGNAEEPALRPVKWTWLGVKSLVQSTKDGLASGVQKDPASMAGEGALGAVKGTGNLATDVGKGIVGAPLPQKKEPHALSYEQAAMVVINGQINKDACCPEQGGKCCAEKKEEAQPDPNAKFRQPAPSTVLPAEPKPGATQLVVEESRVEKAQRVYVPIQAGYRSNRPNDGSGNLLKLAK